MSTKICRSCGREKDRSQFNRRSDSPDGLQSYCRTCQMANREKLTLTAGAIGAVNKYLDELLPNVKRIKLLSYSIASGVVTAGITDHHGKYRTINIRPLRINTKDGE